MSLRQISTRRLRVVKYRGSLHGTNEYPFLISDKGISVLPITSLGLGHTAPSQRVSSGVLRLDAMLGGKGYYRGSSILVSGTVTGVVPYTQLDVPDPIAVAVDRMGLPWFSFIIKVGAITGLTSVMLVLTYAQTRVFYQMARDGLLPDVFAHVHDRFRTPVRAARYCSASSSRSVPPCCRCVCWATS